MTLVGLAALAILTPLLAIAWFIVQPFCRGLGDFLGILVAVPVALARVGFRRVIHPRRARHPEWPLLFELVQAAAKTVMNSYGANLVLPPNAVGMRTQADVLGTIHGALACEEHGTAIERKTIHGLEHIWLRSKANRRGTAGPKADNARRFVILYYHGGGYTILSPRLYINFCNRLRAAALKAIRQREDLGGGNGGDFEIDVFLANYRKSPEHQYPIPHDDATKMFEYITEEIGVPLNHLLVAGDSAGGGLVLSTLLRFRDQQRAAGLTDAALRMPLGAILSFPLTDFSDDPNPSRGVDCILSHAFIRATTIALLPTPDDPKTWGTAAAAFCDLTGLPPTLVQVGSADYLYDNSLKLYAKAQRDGVADWELHDLPNMPHSFIMFPEWLLPGSGEGVARMGEFVAKRIAASMASAGAE